MEQKLESFVKMMFKNSISGKKRYTRGNTVHGTFPPERRRIAEKTYGDATYRDAALPSK
jgi:hypothetical protein